MKTRIVVLGAGFGGLELTTILSDTFGEAIDLVLIDRSEAFVFGFSKLDVMFGRVLRGAAFASTGVRLPSPDKDASGYCGSAGAPEPSRVPLRTKW